MGTQVLPQHRVKNRRTGQGRKVNGSWKKSKRGKYNAKGRYVNDQWCASEAEALRYEQLLRMEEAGKICDLECQPVYRIDIKGTLICKYKADFRYFPARRGVRAGFQPIVEDVKGYPMPDFKIKHKLVEALHTEVLIVPSNDVRKGLTEGMTAREYLEEKK